MVFPFFTQVIVFLLLELLAVGEGVIFGDDAGDGVTTGDAEGDASTTVMSAVLSDGVGVGVGEGVGVGVGVGVAVARAGKLAIALGSKATLPNPSITFLGKLAGSGVSERCFITERTSGWNPGKT